MSEEGTTGKLYIVGTPIGNLEDITFRALRILKEVNLIAAEDTRHTMKLLNHYDIKQRLISYHQHNERERLADIIEKLQQGQDVALVSDAGMPGISDPGSILIAEAVAQGIKVIPIPGPSALITGLVASGLGTDSFMFVGFLSRKKTEQLKYLAELAEYTGTIIIYESPHRVVATLKNIHEILGERQVVLARELTKIHEEFIRRNITDLLKSLEQQRLLGEQVILVSGFTGEKREEEVEFDLNEAFAKLSTSTRAGTSLKAELKIIAKKSGKTLKEIYRLYLDSKKINV